MINALTVDLEDYYHVSGFEREIARSEWHRYPSRVASNTERVLSLLEQAGKKATFFVLGWIADQHPQVVRRVAQAGHEIACHSYWHRLAYRLTPSEFREDTARAKQVIEDAAGLPVVGYRAPSYSIVPSCSWALDILGELGFRYDSSIFPVAHDRYGWPGHSRFATRVGKSKSTALTEFPPSTYPLGRHAIPVAGGGYLRILPYRYTKWALEHLNEVEHQPGVVYFHPWELDPEQPRVCASTSSWWRHRFGIATMEAKLRRLLREFEFTPMGTIVRSLDSRRNGGIGLFKELEPSRENVRCIRT